MCQAGTSLIQPQSNSTVPPRFGSLTSSTPCPSSHWRARRSRRSGRRCAWRPATASAMWSAWPWVIAMWVGSTSSRGRDRGRVVGLQERVDQDGRLALAQLEAGMAVELDLHPQLSPSGSSRFRSSPPSVPSRRRRQPSSPSAPPRRAGRGRRRSARRGRGRSRPSASRPRAARRTSRPRRAPRRAPSAAAAPPGRRPLGLGEALGVEQPLDRGFELALVGHRLSLDESASVGRAQRRRRARPARPPTTPPTRPATRSAVESKSGSASRTAAATATPIRRTPRRSRRAPRRGGSRTRRRPRRAPSRCRRRSRRSRPGRWRSPLAASIPSEPQATSSSAVGGAAEPPLDPGRRRSPGRPRRRTGSRRRRRRRGR